MSSALDQLKQYTTVVADTGDFEQIAQYGPRDATTNPSLILKAAQQPRHAPLVHDTVAGCRALPLAEQVERVLVQFGLKILAAVPGRVSTEVDARMSFDAAAMVAQGRRLIALYEAAGIRRDRILIKVAATWEGVQAAQVLEREGIHTNLTLVFSLCQAAICGEAGVTLISPFVGRIYDWYKRAAGAAWDEAAMAGAADPGVQSVRRIHAYYRRFGIPTEVMGASFRNVGQILALAGCDLLTISPELLAQLRDGEAVVHRSLPVPDDASPTAGRLVYTEATFRAALNDDAMATEKLAEGIRLFAADAARLEQLVLSA